MVVQRSLVLGLLRLLLLLLIIEERGTYWYSPLLYEPIGLILLHC